MAINRLISKTNISTMKAPTVSPKLSARLCLWVVIILKTTRPVLVGANCK
eukprot:XP_001708821.1 Hypothetical protein GL50803_39493 [Giardia lamblia ATCC 50803]